MVQGTITLIMKCNVNSVYKFYQFMLHKHPFVLQGVQTAALTGVGDFIAQKIVEKKTWDEFDVKRFLIFSSFGGIVIGPAIRVWYGILDRGLKGSRYVVAKKVVLDQFVFAPSFLAVVISFLNLAHGKSVSQVKEKMKADYVPILKANYMIWPAVQVLNFSVIPLNYQVPFVQSVAVFWNTYLSWKANADVKHD